MSKFKVGDKVRLFDGKVGVVESGPFPRGMSEMYHIRLEDGRLTDSAERNMTAANASKLAGDDEIVALASTNPVVQNALNARNNTVAINARSSEIATAIKYLVSARGEFRSARKWLGNAEGDDDLEGTAYDVAMTMDDLIRSVDNAIGRLKKFA